ncbi:ankyrin repeat domain-containing protein [Streptosporangium canum]|uniref:ankyrin repeat domain-containing protein n=1 Tax=Streptosporangium canum TaxID=324952 RepID=UPI0037B22A04
MIYLDTEDPLALAVVTAIQGGDIDELHHLLSEHTDLARVRLGDPEGMSRTLLHVVTDWPGHYPGGPRTVEVLVAAGAEVNGRFAGPHTETALHWAASTDDAPVLAALLEAGADIEASGSVVDGGTPLADAVAFGQWNAARRLVEHGARVNLWQAAALGLAECVRDLLQAAPTPSRQDLTGALWCACHGGQREMAEYLLSRGAELNWVGYDELTALDAACRSGAEELADWLRGHGAKTAAQLR